MDLRLVLIGAGRWGSKIASCLKDMGVCLAAVVDIRKDAAEKVAREYGCKDTKVFTSLDELLGWGLFDAAIVAVPPEKLCDVTLKIVKLGKHVLVEKPVAYSAKHVETLIREVERRDVVAMPGFILRFHPALRAVKDIVRRFVKSGPTTFIALRLLDRGGRVWPVGFDLAIHDVDLVMWLSGLEFEPRSANLERVEWGEEVMRVYATRDAHSFFLEVRGAWRARRKVRVLKVISVDGFLEVDQDAFTVKLVYKDIVETKVVESGEDPLSRELREFMRRIEGSEADPEAPTLYDALRAVRFVEKAYEVSTATFSRG